MSRRRPAAMPAFLTAAALPRRSARGCALCQVRACTSPPPPPGPAQRDRPARVRTLDARVVLRAAETRVRTVNAALARQTDTAPGAERDQPGLGALREMLAGLEKDLRAVKRVEGEDAVIVSEKERALVQLRAARKRLEIIVWGIESKEREEEVRQKERAGAAEVGDEGLEGVSFEPPPGAGGDADLEDVSTEKAEAAVVDVSKVKDSILEGRDMLIRRASTVGAGLGDTVSTFVREDGSVDLEKVRTNVRGGLNKFGETWQRLNGQEPRMHSDVDLSGELGDMSASPDAVTDVRSEKTVAVRDEAKVARLRAEIGKLESELSDASKAREGVLRKEDQLGKLIRAREIRAMDDNVSAVRRTLAVRVMQLETENIFVSLSEEIESSGFDVMDQRVMVAEFGDIDERLESLAVFLDTNEPTLIDDDEVGVLASDIQDLKMRLGLDAPLYSSRVDRVMVRQAISASIVKAKVGVDFYTRGMKLFGGDFGYAARLFRRGLVGYTLSPREVRTLRRTGRDLLTLIPFTIILIAPLTPVGHVLIFGFIQRYWPDFFPSTFTERRQSLMRRHEKLAKSIQEEGEADGSLSAASDGDVAGEVQGRKMFGRLGILKRFGLAAQAASDAPRREDAVMVADPISATSSDVLSTLAEDAQVEKVDVATRGPRGGTRVVLDDLHLAD